ncbi:BatD family protein [Aeromonas bivalvium]|uniref:BatD family protein n=1 Tax=Aeromonas bivalvium TaxID=440079 RepID=UPI0038D148AC
MSRRHRQLTPPWLPWLLVTLTAAGSVLGTEPSLPRQKGGLGDGAMTSSHQASPPPKVEILAAERPDEWRLIIEAPGRWPAGALIITPLLRQFAVGRVALQQGMGEDGPSTRWLIPLHGQPAPLPPLRLANWSIPLPPFPAREADTAPPPPRVTQRASLAHEGPLYPGQPFVYALHITLPDPVRQPGLEEPAHPDFTIRRLGEDEWRPGARAGEPGVLIRRWLFQARRAGDFTLTAPRLQASYLLGDRPQPLAGRAGPLSLHVDEAPVPLVARRLTLSQQFTSRQATLGEPIIRTLRLRLEDGDGSQVSLPEVHVAGLRVQGDGSQRRERFLANGRLLYEQEWRQALRATQPGDYLLPEIHLPWLNTRNGRIEQLILPGQRVSFTPDPASPSASAAPSGPHVPLLIWALLPLLLVPCRPRLGRWLAFYRLQQALRRGDAEDSRHALLHWRRRRWPDPLSPAILWPGEIPVSAPMAAALDTLQAACFGTLTHFDGAPLALALCTYETRGIAGLLRRVAWLDGTYRHKDHHKETQ